MPRRARRSPWRVSAPQPPPSPAGNSVRARRSLPISAPRSLPEGAIHSSPRRNQAGRVSKVAGFDPPDEGRPHIVRSRVARAGGTCYLADWWMPTASRRYFARNSRAFSTNCSWNWKIPAVAGVRVDHQLVVRQTSVVSMLEDGFERLLACKNDVKVLVKVSG